MKYTTVVFDLDGTLLNTLLDLAASVNFALRENGLPQRSTDEVRRFIGNGVRVLIRRSVPEGTSEDLYESTFKSFENHYKKNSRNMTVPYEGVTELLRDLKAMGYNLAIVSNKIDFAVKDLCEEFFGDVIEIAVGDSPDTNNKPEPDMVFKALKMLGETAENAVYVGDTDVDLETAKNAGMDCISVSWGFRTREELGGYEAKMIADVPDDIKKFI